MEEYGGSSKEIGNTALDAAGKNRTMASVDVTGEEVVPTRIIRGDMDGTIAVGVSQSGFDEERGGKPSKNMDNGAEGCRMKPADCTVVVESPKKMKIY